MKSTDIKQSYSTVRTCDEQQRYLRRWVKLRGGDLTLSRCSLVGIAQSFNGEHAGVQTCARFAAQDPTGRREEGVKILCQYVGIGAGIDVDFTFLSSSFLSPGSCSP